MSLHIMFIVLIFISNGEIWSQEYFPLQVGNRWDFQANEWDGIGHGSRDTITMIITGDTLMSNGYKYFRTNQTTKINDFVRADSIGIYYYDTLNDLEWLFFMYDIAISNEYPNGEHLSVGYMMNELDSSHFIRIYKWNDGKRYLFGDSARIIAYSVDTGMDDSYSIFISLKYGFIETHESGPIFNYDLSLIGCKLSDKVYGTLTRVDKSINELQYFSLSQNYPNPFNPITKIKYTIPTPPSSSPLIKGRNEVDFVTLKVYDILGNEITTLVNEEKPTGNYEIEFDGSKLASGIYFYVLKAGGYRFVRKMSLIK